MNVNELIEELQDIANAGAGEYTVLSEDGIDFSEVDEILVVDAVNQVKLVKYY
ncbi:MAG: hypothetical protein LBC40_00940 [Dysgonamonadaceae bacterium]|jgi:hypothetical protein|nr:hypothetical protein [Dysgonamonadaceae bacterium]